LGKRLKHLLTVKRLGDLVVLQRRASAQQGA